MGSLATAFYTAALALIGRIAFGAWTRFDEKRSVAAALAGEISAYVDLLTPPLFVENLRRIAAKTDLEARTASLRAFPELPTGHPVFEAIAGKIGVFSHKGAQAISRFYNMITGLRLLLTSSSSATFLDLPRREQDFRLLFLASTIEREAVQAKALIDGLKWQAGRK